MVISQDLPDANILITGGKGFIGSHLADELVSRGANVTILDCHREHSGANDANIEDLGGSVTFLEESVEDATAVEEAVRGQDLIFHLAAQVSRVESNKNPQSDVQTNCIGTLNVLKAVQNSENSPRVVFTSSRAVYGISQENPISEDHETEPLDIYGANKLAAEKYCKIYNREGVETVIARLANVYGPRAQVHDTNYGVINVFARRAIEDETLTVFEPGTMKRDCVFVTDAVEVLIALGTHGERGEVYNVGTGQGHTILEIAEYLVDISGSGDVELVPWPDDWEGLKVGDFIADNSKLTEDLNWQPKTDLETGLEKTVQFYESNLEAYKK
jgi:nucleoside-diphosphate-sugar epimerase